MGDKKAIGAELEQRQADLLRRYYTARVQYLASVIDYETQAQTTEEAMLTLKRCEFERERAYRTMVIIKTEVESLVPLGGTPDIEVVMGALESAEAAEAGHEDR